MVDKERPIPFFAAESSTCELHINLSCPWLRNAIPATKLRDRAVIIRPFFEDSVLIIAFSIETIRSSAMNSDDVVYMCVYCLLPWTCKVITSPNCTEIDRCLRRSHRHKNGSSSSEIASETRTSVAIAANSRWFMKIQTSLESSTSKQAAWDFESSHVRTARQPNPRCCRGGNFSSNNFKS